MIWLWFVTLFAFFIKGLCGFANSLVFTTLMSFSSSIVHISPIMLLLNYPTNLILVWNGRKSLNWKICGPLCIMVIAGIIPGTFFFTNTDTRLLEGIFGVAVVLISLEMLFNKRKAQPSGQKVNWKLSLLGVLSGFVCGFCNTGVLVGTYLSKVTDNTQSFKANACIVYFLSDNIKLLMFLCLGVLSREILLEALSIFPIAMLGLWLGMKSSKIMNETIAKKVVLVMLIISGLGLVINNL